MIPAGMRPTRILAGAAVALALVSVGCGEDREPRAGPGSPSPTFEDVTDGSPGAGEYLAVFDTAEDPEDLEPLQEEILETAPANIAISPAGCWEEVPEELGISSGDYVAGVVAASAEGLQEAVDAVGRDPVFEGQVTLIACD
jgi:hypothetical protein